MIEDTIVRAADVAFAPFALHAFTGRTEAAFLSTDLATAPFIALLRLEPGATLAKHCYTEVVKAVYVLEGEMINDRARLATSSLLAHGRASGTGRIRPKLGAL